jgi:PD-(D/E)XK nuclease superfamily
VNIFGELEGLAGEQLATAGLRLLILRSPACRDAIVRLLDGLSPHGPLNSTSHFSCYTEYGTSDGSRGPGRLDLVVELDNIVVGIEVKLAAAFQEDQPDKYNEELGRVAKLLGEIRREPVRYFLIVLAPKNREDEILPHVRASQRFLSWESVLSALKGASGGDPFVAVLIEEFDRHLRDRLDFLPHFQDWAHHLTTQWSSRGTQYQRELLRKLFGVLPNPSGRLGSADSWVGYYFSPEADGRRSWIGFVPRTRLSADQDGACLVVGGHHTVQKMEQFRGLDMADPLFVDGDAVPSWEIAIDPSWNSPAAWTAALDPFLRVQDIDA